MRAPQAIARASNYSHLPFKINTHCLPQYPISMDYKWT
jgi:hypothetical protein